jgi:hypothetical protein
VPRRHHRRTRRTPAALEQGLVPGWDTLEAESFERARFILHHDSCDAVLVDASLCGAGGETGLGWLAGQHEVPVLVLADFGPEAVAAALEQGVLQWLPRQMALGFPRLLRAALGQAAEWAALRQHLMLASGRLQESRLQVHRIVSLMWDAGRGEARHRWLTQGHMMARLHEECPQYALGHRSPSRSARCASRHRRGDDVTLARQAVERITEAKRRCDVLGQYGPHGFMLLLVNTTAPGAEQCCRRIRRTLVADVRAGQGSIDAIFGLASCPSEGDDGKTLLSRAERALELTRS